VKKILLLSLSLSLTACGGGGSSEEQPVFLPTPTTPPVNEVMPVGVWSGDIVAADNSVVEVVALIASDGETRLIDTDGEQSRFMLTLDGSAFSGDGVAYNEYGDFVANLAIEGEYTATSITGLAKDGDIQTSTFSLSLNSETGNGASFAVIEGNYATYDGLTSIAIDVDGVLSGSDNDGCVYNGAVTVPDGAINLYKLEMDVSSCSIYSGAYTGLATYAPLFEGDEYGFIFQMDNGTYMVTDMIFK
jgi:hypothetical protein